MTVMMKPRIAVIVVTAWLDPSEVWKFVSINPVVEAIVPETKATAAPQNVKLAYQGFAGAATGEAGAAGAGVGVSAITTPFLMWSTWR